MHRQCQFQLTSLWESRPGRLFWVSHLQVRDTGARTSWRADFNSTDCLGSMIQVIVLVVNICGLHPACAGLTQVLVLACVGSTWDGSPRTQSYPPTRQCGWCESAAAISSIAHCVWIPETIPGGLRYFFLSGSPSVSPHPQCKVICTMLCAWKSAGELYGAVHCSEIT